jgi:hypothetical protein
MAMAAKVPTAKLVTDCFTLIHRMITAFRMNWLVILARLIISRPLLF